MKAVRPLCLLRAVACLQMSRLPLTGSDQGTGSTPCGGPLIFVKSEEQDYCLGVKL